MWILRTVTEGQPEKTFRILPGNERTIGRATGADFIVDAALVSRVHCRLTALAGGELEIRDLESTNGTFVNGERVETARLASGDRLQVGRVELVALRGRGLALRSARYSSTNGFVVRSRRIVVSGPWPGWTIALVAEREQHLGNRPHQHLVVAARQIGPADRARKQRVADEQVLARLPFLPICRHTPPGQWPGVWCTRTS